MAFEIPKIKYTGKIQEVVIGTGQKAVRAGGASCYPFYLLLLHNNIHVVCDARHFLFVIPPVHIGYD